METKHRLLKKTIIYILLTIIAAVLLFPIIFMTANSFMDENEVLAIYSGSNGRLENENGEVEFQKFRLIPRLATLMQYYHALLREPYISGNVLEFGFLLRYLY